jgi:hypothetical protein
MVLGVLSDTYILVGYMYFRVPAAAFVCAVATVAPAVSAPAAYAAGSVVTVGGTVGCGSWPPPLPYPRSWLARSARLHAANGEAHGASIALVWYTVTFDKVPASGEKVDVSVTCRDGRKWGKSFFLLPGPALQRINLFWH